MTGKLSICIPTYNKGKYIRQTLDSILSQDSTIQIVVSDNASTDDTSFILEEFCNIYRNIIYYRWLTNQGADRNFLKIVELATADYCWLLGSDDIIEKGGLKIVRDALEKYPDLTGLSVLSHNYDVDLKRKLPGRPISHHQEDHLFRSAEECYQEIGHHFGYLSAHIIRRSSWMEQRAILDVSKYFNAYVHTYIIGNMLKSQPRWLLIAKPCVGWRSGNDSFLSDGAHRRLEIDIKGYEAVAAGIFGKTSRTYRVHKRCIVSRYIYGAIHGARLRGEKRSFFFQALRLCLPYYYDCPVFWIKVLPFFFMPRFFLQLLHFIYRNIKKDEKPIPIF